MKRIKLWLAAVAMTIFGSGCSLMAPQYSPSLDNVGALRSGGEQASRAGTFTTEPGKENANPLRIRANTMVSPYNQN